MNRKDRPSLAACREAVHMLIREETASWESSLEGGPPSKRFQAAVFARAGVLTVDAQLQKDLAIVRSPHAEIFWETCYLVEQLEADIRARRISGEPEPGMPGTQARELKIVRKKLQDMEASLTVSQNLDLFEDLTMDVKAQRLRGEVELKKPNQVYALCRLNVIESQLRDLNASFSVYDIDKN